jgi:hypothetical protein
MDAIVRTVANTVLRATVFKSMRGTSMLTAITLSVFAAGLLLITR